MIITEEFKNIIDEDIMKCQMALSEGNKSENFTLMKTLKAKYSKIIDGFGEGLRDTSCDRTGEVIYANIETLKQKLILFKAMEYENSYSTDSNAVVVNNNFTPTITISFEMVRSKIDEMTALPDKEIEEIKGKLDELESIVNSSERKSKKWERAKSIIRWTADKGVDVGIAFLPLLMKLGS